MPIDLFDKADIVPGDSMSTFLNEFRFEIYGFGTWRRNETNVIENFIVSEYELSYLEKGQLEIKTRDESFICEEGSFVLFEPFTYYTARKIYDQDMEIYNIFFDIIPEHRQVELLETLTPKGNIVWKKQELPNIVDTISQTLELCRTSSDGELLLVESLLKSCLIYIMRANLQRNQSIVPQTSKALKQKNSVVKSAIEYIVANIEKPIKLNYLCEHLGISESNLYKCFVDITNNSPKQFILKYKMKKAKRLINHQDYSVKQAAYALGFSSEYHFSSAFKKIHGKAPSHYSDQLTKRAWQETGES